MESKSIFDRLRDRFSQKRNTKSHSSDGSSNSGGSRDRKAIEFPIVIHRTECVGSYAGASGSENKAGGLGKAMCTSSSNVNVIDHRGSSRHPEHISNSEENEIRHLNTVSKDINQVDNFCVEHSKGKLGARHCSTVVDSRAILPSGSSSQSAAEIRITKTLLLVSTVFLVLNLPSHAVRAASFLLQVRITFCICHGYCMYNKFMGEKEIFIAKVSH